MVDQATQAMDLGARMLYLADGLIIADSPGGFTFCLVRWHGESQVPRPFSLGAAGPSRADQLCLDIPPEAFDRECAFRCFRAGPRWPTPRGACTA